MARERAQADRAWRRIAKHRITCVWWRCHVLARLSPQTNELGYGYDAHGDRDETNSFVVHDGQNSCDHKAANRDAQQDDSDATTLVRLAHNQ
jgi:hypothetical protein